MGKNVPAPGCCAAYLAWGTVERLASKGVCAQAKDCTRCELVLDGHDPEQADRGLFHLGETARTGGSISAAPPPTSHLREYSLVDDSLQVLVVILQCSISVGP
jgi:hypothetical protein